MKILPQSLGLGLFLTLVSQCDRLAAQSSGLPFPADVRGTEVRLATQNLSVNVRYALVDRGLIYFSPIFLEQAEINGQPVVAADGSLRIPSGSQHLLTLTFRDPEKGPSGRVDIRAALASAPDVLQETAGIPPQPINSALVATERKVSLILRDPFQGNRPVSLTGESRLADQEGNATPKVDFVLDAPTLETLRRSRSSDIEVAFFQDYPARFETNNVVITVENLQRQVGELRQSIAPIPNGVPGGGGAPGIVLDASFGTGLSQNGTLNKSSLVSDFIRRNVSFSVRYRSGASLDTPLVERLVDFALNRASDFLQKSPFEGTNTFVTLLLRDDIQITTALGRLDEFATQMETGQVDELFTKLVEAVQSNQSVNINTKATVFVGGYGSGKANLAVNLSRSEYLEQLRQEFHQSFRNASAWFKGNIPYLPGIRFSSTLGVDNIRWEDFKSALTEFSTGNITLYRAFSLGLLAGRQTGLTIIEMFNDALRSLDSIAIPAVQVGQISIKNTPWKPLDLERISVSFPEPFGAAPKVIVGLSSLNVNPSQPADLDQFLIDLVVKSVSKNDFELSINTTGGGELRQSLTVGHLAIVWTAVGTKPLRQASTPLLTFEPDHNSDLRSVSTAETSFAATPWISNALGPDSKNKFTLKFSSIPNRKYGISASTDLQSWYFVGTVDAGPNDLTAEFSYTPEARYPHLFFRVEPPPVLAE